MTWKQKATTAIAAIVLGLGMTGGARAALVPLVTNGSFEQIPGGGTFTGKNYFSTVHPTGWSTSSASTTTPSHSNLTFLAAPGTAANGSYLSVYGPFPATSPDGGNFVMSDGLPEYNAPITQTINGLTIGQTYALSFYQAAGQQSGFTGGTTERWQVSFAGSTQLSTKYTLAQGGVGPWQAQTMYFTANSVSSVLSFLAVGTPTGEPPISFLDGVALNAVPEPSTVVLAGAGLLGLGVVNLMRRRRAATAVVA